MTLLGIREARPAGCSALVTLGVISCLLLQNLTHIPIPAVLQVVSRPGAALGEAGYRHHSCGQCRSWGASLPGAPHTPGHHSSPLPTHTKLISFRTSSVPESWSL